jgi:hypothetical protein
MALAMLALAFIACDYATDAFDLKPDIEITWINPVAWSIYPEDTVATIQEIHFVAQNSIDSYLKEMYLEYYATGDTVPFYGPTDPIAMYGKIEGIVDPELVDTFMLLNIPIPLEPAKNYLAMNETAEVLMNFVVIDEYQENADTTTVWFGLWMTY